MTEPNSERIRRTPRAQRRTRRAITATADGNIAPTTVVGIAHLVLGVIGIVSLGSGLLFAPSASPAALITLSLPGVLAILTCLSGLWIADGLRRGAILAMVLDGLRCLSLVVTGQWGLALVISLLLLGAAIWILPTLDQSPSASRDA